MSVDVNVFPQNAYVFFMHTDGIWDLANRTVWLSDSGIQIHNLAQAVATKCERVGVIAQTKLASVKRIFAICALTWIAVWNDELGNRQSTRNASLDAIVVKLHFVNNQTFTLTKPNAHIPTLPINAPAVDCERSAIGLCDREFFETDVCTCLTRTIWARCLWNWNLLIVFNIYNFASIQVNNCVQSTNRMCIKVCLRRWAMPHRCPDHSPTCVEMLWHLRTNRPCLHVHGVYVVNAART